MEGADVLAGGADDDSLSGGADNEIFVAAATADGSDEVTGDAGFDAMSYSARSNPVIVGSTGWPTTARPVSTTTSHLSSR